MAEEDGKPAAYKVGFGKPPLESRFQPGTSGNPKGRKTKSKNFKTLLEQELDTLILVKDRGKERRISKREALAMQMVAGALKGDRKNIEMIMRLQDKQIHRETVDYTPQSDQDWELYLNRHFSSNQLELNDDRYQKNAEKLSTDDDVSE